MRGRIRTIKPEVLLDEELWDAEQLTKLPLLRAFTGLWMYADREGRFEWRARPLKSQILPYWDGDMEAVLDALRGYEFIDSYEVDGRLYGLVRNFKKHQLVNQREAKSELPPPPAGMQCEDRVPASVPPDTRAAVFARASTCTRCGASEDLTIDHVFPRCAGGNHALTNLRILCRACNSARPTAGQALIDDLAKDGLTFDDLPRLCMHVHAPEPHVHARGEGKGRELERSGKGRDLPAGAGAHAHAREEAPAGAAGPSKPAEPKPAEQPPAPTDPLAQTGRMRRVDPAGDFELMAGVLDRAAEQLKWSPPPKLTPLELRDAVTRAEQAYRERGGDRGEVYAALVHAAMSQAQASGKLNLFASLLRSVDPWSAPPRDVRKGFAEPSPPGSFKQTNLDEAYGPKPADFDERLKRSGGRR